MQVARVFTTPKGSELPIILLKGKEYLEVKYRLVWFREERPDWSISTEFVNVTDKGVMAKATISDTTGRVISTGHKTETADGFPDFIEKAETGSIGRALAFIGFGTQFAADELDEGERIVDAPVPPTRPVVGTKPQAVPAPVDASDLGSFVITFGKFIDKRLDSIDAFELNNWLSFMAGQGKLSTKAKEAVDAAEAYLKTR
jgi:hypothetical protein